MKDNNEEINKNIEENVSNVNVNDNIDNADINETDNKNSNPVKINLKSFLCITVIVVLILVFSIYAIITTLK